MRPIPRIARVTSLFTAGAVLSASIAAAHPRGWMVAAFAAAAPQQTSRLSFDAEFPVAALGKAYMQSLYASGGAGGYKFAEGGTLPPGMQWVPAGQGLLLRGTPTQAGDYSLRILVNDALGQQITRDVVFHVTPNDTGATLPLFVNENLTTTMDTLLPTSTTASNTKTYKLFETLTTNMSVALSIPIVISPSALPGGREGYAYSSVTFTALSGSGTVTISSSSALPTGMSFTQSSSGLLLSGTPTQSGTFPLTVSATDQGGDSATQTYSLVVAAAPALVITPTTTPNAEVGVSYFGSSFSATGGFGSIALSTSGTLPTGITFSQSGSNLVLSGTPTQSGTFPFAVIATDQLGDSATQNYSLTVFPALAVSPAALTVTPTVGQSTVIDFTFTGGFGSANLFLSGGSLPPGLSFNNAGNSQWTLSGTPTKAGTYNFSITATEPNGVGSTASQSYTLTVTQPQYSITPVAFPNATSGTAYSQSFSIVGNPAGYALTMTNSGGLPSGLSYAASGETVTVSGTPAGVATTTTYGPFSFNLTDQYGNVQTVGPLNLVVQPTVSATLTPTSYNFPNQTVGHPNLLFGSYNFTLTNTGSATLTNTVTVTGANASSFVLSYNTCTSALAATANCTIGITFEPTASGPAAATLNVSSASSISTITETSSMTGTGVIGTLTVTPDPISFSATAVNTSTTIPVTLSASGGGVTLNGTQVGTVSGADAAYFTFYAISCGYSPLNAGQSCSAVANFTPNAVRTFNATLTIASSDPNSPAVIPLTGTGAAAHPAATITPSPYSFGSVALNITATNNFTVTNTGNVALSFASPQLAAPYSIVANSCTAPLAVGATCTVSVGFTPTTNGATNGTLTLTDTTGDNFTASLSGTGGQSTTPPVITVPANIIAEATSGSGAVVYYTATAVDSTGTAITPSCMPASGTTFALGTTTVTCTATDSHTNQSSKSFMVTVQDTTPPVITVPANITIPATNSSGAAVTYTATATDAVDGRVAVNCTPASGSTFPPGMTTVTCTATDSHNNTSHASFTVTVQPITPPVITVPANIIAEATSGSGAVVYYTATAVDSTGTAITPSCMPASGTTFALGTTTVTCTATDSHANQSSKSFTVTVQDTTPPAITVPANITTTATSASGAAVTYSATATDLVDGTVSVSCMPASGSTFPIGTTTVTCTATDAHNNTSHASFTVTVQDTTPPVITVPANITTTATSASGAVVTYTATATDLVDGTDPVACTPASGATFPLGTTTVTCAATDSAHNSSTASFTVTVHAPPYVFVTNSAGSVSSLFINGAAQSSAVAGGGIGAAVDRNGLVFSITADGTGVSTFNDDGTLANTTSSVLNGASALAIDGGDQLWIAFPGGLSTAQILSPPVAGSVTDPTLLQPGGMAIDLSGNVWITDSQSNTVHEIVGGAAPAAPIANAVQSKTMGVQP